MKLFHRKRRTMICITPKGEFALRMIDAGFAPETGDGYDIRAILSAWEDGKAAFAKAVCANKLLRQMLQYKRNANGSIETVDTTAIMQALEAAFCEPFTNSGSER